MVERSRADVAVGDRARPGALARRWSAVRAAVSAMFEREMEQRRGALWLPVLLGTGILVYFALPSEPPLWATLVLAAVPLAGTVWAARSARFGWFRLLLTLTALTAGTALMKVRTEIVAAPIVAVSYSGDLTGWVEELERFGPREVRIVVRVQFLEGLASDETPERVRITVRGAFDGVAVGAGISGAVSLLPPAAPVFPGGYDFGRELFYRGIGASGFSFGPPDIVDLGPPPLGLAWRIPIERLRQHIGTRIEATLPGDTGQIANALITGDRGGLSEEMTEAYQVSGLAHILSISGLHMSLVAAFTFFILRGGLALIPIFALRYPIKKWAAGGTLGVAGFYLLLSGADVAAQRSFIMLAVMMLAILVDRRALSTRNIAITALVVLLLTPEAILTAGFQMSFAATLALIAGYELVAERRAGRLQYGPAPRRTMVRIALLWVGGLVLTSILAGLATAPFGAFHFNRTQPLSLLANLAAGPVVSLLVMFPAIFAVILMPFGLEEVPLEIMDRGLSVVNAVAVRTTELTGDGGMVAASPMIALLLAVLGLLWVCLWRERWRWVGALPIVVAILLAGNAPMPVVVVDEVAGAAMVRAPDGRYRFMGDGATFEAETWLRMDADPRAADDPTLAEGVLCDPLGCTAPLAGGGRVALVTVPQALVEDCDRAAIVIAVQPVPGSCRALAVSGERLERLGVHALYADRNSPTGYRVVTVRSEEWRPWMPPQPDQ